MFKRCGGVLIVGLAFFAAMVLTGCTGDEGPAGPAGTVECMTCHGDDSAVPAIAGQYETSQHGTGENFERNDEDCALCHTNEGFQHYVATGELSSPDNPSRVGCFTCHAPHSTGDFSLRVDTAVDLNEGETYDYGSSNLCVNCHQSRVVDPPVGDNIEVTSSRWGPHHGPQGNFLAGDLGYMVDDLRTYDYHAGSQGCVTCHMAAPYGSQAGGHSMSMEYLYHDNETAHLDGCANCHNVYDEEGDPLPPWENGFDYQGVQTEVETKMAELQAILVAEGLVTESGSVVTGTFTLDQAEAVFYFRCVLEDRSNGIHNPSLTVDILDYSIGLFD